MGGNGARLRLAHGLPRLHVPRPLQHVQNVPCAGPPGGPGGPAGGRASQHPKNALGDHPRDASVAEAVAPAPLLLPPALSPAPGKSHIERIQEGLAEQTLRTAGMAKLGTTERHPPFSAGSKEQESPSAGRVEGSSPGGSR